MNSDSYWTGAGVLVEVELPDAAVAPVLRAIHAVCDLRHGDYDQVSCTSSVGSQRFRARMAARNTATKESMAVPCATLRFFVAAAERQLDPVLRAIYDAHPYEEPVIYIRDTSRCRHVRGVDEDNPNRFWNKPSADWVPEPHRN